jgi:hypothetical protein
MILTDPVDFHDLALRCFLSIIIYIIAHGTEFQ